MVAEGMSVWEGGGGTTTVPRLSETDNPSVKIGKTYYLSDANYQTDNPSLTNNPSVV